MRASSSSGSLNFRAKALIKQLSQKEFEPAPQVKPKSSPSPEVKPKLPATGQGVASRRSEHVSLSDKLRNDYKDYLARRGESSDSVDADWAREFGKSDMVEATSNPDIRQGGSSFRKSIEDEEHIPQPQSQVATRHGASLSRQGSSPRFWKIHAKYEEQLDGEMRQEVSEVGKPPVVGSEQLGTKLSDIASAVCGLSRMNLDMCSTLCREFEELKESLHTEVSGISLSTRSILHSELDKFKKSCNLEASLVIDSMPTFSPEDADESEESIQSSHEQVDFLMIDAMRSIVRAELEESMKSFPVGDFATNQTVRSMFHKELEQLIKFLVEQGIAIDPSLPAMPTLQSISTQRSVPVHKSQPSMEQEAVRMNREQLVSPVRKASPEPSRHVTLPVLAEPLLGEAAHTGEWSSHEHLSQPGSPKKPFSCKRTFLKVDDHAQKETIKEMLKAALTGDNYNVEEFYQSTGLCQALARHDSWFSNVSLAVVVANVLWIGVDEDLNRHSVLCNAPLLSQVMNNAFCMFFTLEVAVHFLAFANKMQALRDGKFLFDLLLVAFMMWETWIEVILYKVFDVTGSSKSAFITQLFRFFRLFRLTRVPRIVRLCVSVPELMIMMKGIAAAMRSVMVILLFLLFTIFIFGILFTELLRDTDPFEESFAHVLLSMHTLFLQVICGVDTDFMNDLLAASVGYYILHVMFLFAANFTLLNMLIGVLCDVVSTVAEEEKEGMYLEQLEFEITNIANKMDVDGDGLISEYEFGQFMCSKEALKSLDSIGVDVVSFAGLQSFIFRDEDDLTIGEFCSVIAQFRGSKVATVKDLVDTHKFISIELRSILGEIKKLLENPGSIGRSSPANFAL